MSTQTLPLYDSLLAQTNQKIARGEIVISDLALKLADGTDTKSVLAAKLESLPPDAAEQISILLIHFYYLTGGTGNPFKNIIKTASSKSSYIQPYKLRGNTHGKGFSFILEQVHPMFHAFLWTYCKPS